MRKMVFFVLASAYAGLGGLALAAGEDHGSVPGHETTAPSSAPPSSASSEPSVDLTEKQLGLIKIGRLASFKFQVEKRSVGSIDFDEDTQVQVFTPYQGRIIAVFAKIDDRVKAGQPRFSIDSPDLVQAESTLIQTAGVLDLNNRTLSRLRRLVPAGGGAQKDLEQAISDQQTAAGNFNAARDALRIFGKDQADIDRLVDDRRVDSTLVIKNPIDGIVTARSAAPGLFLQPGGTPAPMTVADVSTKWMIANFTEADASALRVGQDVYSRVLAIPDRIWRGHITAIGESIDPGTRRFVVRSDISDPDNILRPGMFADFAIRTGPSIDAPALPLSGAVREGDGTMTAWVTQDRRHFTQRTLKLGLEQKGLYQVIDGLHAGEMVVTDGAVYLTNILEAGPSD